MDGIEFHNHLSSVRRNKHVKNPLPIPTSCPHCQATVALVSNARIYGRTYGEWPWAYLCKNKDCGAYVGMHPRSNIPLGTLATAQIRDARKEAKSYFNPIWEQGDMSRTEAYTWLSARMDIPVAACHFGWFTLEQCEAAIKILMESEAVSGR